MKLSGRVEYATGLEIDCAREGVEGEPITAILGDLRVRLCSAGALPEGDDPGARQWRLLRQGAAERRRLFAHDANKWLTSKGGSEHRSLYNPKTGRWEKLTHENGAGWWVDLEDFLCLPATPLQYLERLALVNELFEDEIQFLGIDVGPGPHTLRIRTSQPHVQGDAPSPETLAAFLAKRGFARVHEKLRIGAYDASSWRRDAWWLFDVRPMNFVQAGNTLHPIDVIVENEEAR